jgi:dipeptidyl aminopeptidase/acylaminoacyl peptidase
MTSDIVAPYGAWTSPLSAARLATASASIGQARACGDLLLWTETRPAEGGRVALLSRDAAGRVTEVLPAGFSVRTRVHEYGGMAFARAGRTLLFANDADQRLYAVEPGRDPQPLTPAGLRYADGAATVDGRCVLFIREDHRAAGEPANGIVMVDPLQPGEGTVLYDRSDFAAFPRPNADGSRLAFISLDHPQMPWDGTQLHVGTLRGQALVDVQTVAGGNDESVLEPCWDVDGTLYFLSDRSGGWQLYRWRDGAVGPVAPESAALMGAEIGAPLWQLGQSSYALLGDGCALACVCRKARDELVLIDLARGAVTPLPLPFAAFGSIGAIGPRSAFALAAAEDELPALIAIDIASGRHDVIRRPSASPLPAAYVSHAEAIEFPTAAGADGEPRSAHAFFYPPRNPAYASPPGMQPPLLVVLHGGPTGQSSPALNLQRQFWTTRGFAVVDVNYGGSSGFGRDYRRRLRGQWGVVDLADAVAAVRFLADAGRIDRKRVVIRGGSAGGFTVLCALAFTDVFAAGVNYFGVADLASLAADTHKFESRYLDSLVAPLPEGEAIYRARSPIHHLQRMQAALITFQGAEDKAVPPEQSRAIVAAVRARGLPVAYLEFEGEQHGFRRAENIVRALEAELYFLGRVLGYTPADDVAPIAIDNLAAS